MIAFKSYNRLILLYFLFLGIVKYFLKILNIKDTLLSNNAVMENKIKT